MKKRIFAMLFAVVLVVAAAVPAFAASSLVPSVENKGTPANESGDGVSFVGLNTASDSSQLKADYKELKDAESLLDVSRDLKKLGKKLNKKEADSFVVTDVFGLDVDEESKKVTVKMGLTNYTANDKVVVMFKANGASKWTVIDDVTLTANVAEVELAGKDGTVAVLKFTADIVKSGSLWWIVFPIVFGGALITCCVFIGLNLYRIKTEGVAEVAAEPVAEEKNESSDEE